jgi:hypothetical protein
MAKSKGQMKDHGHSHGPFGHGGHMKAHEATPSIPSHKADHMRSMVGRGDQTVNGPMPMSGGASAIQDGMAM